MNAVAGPNAKDVCIGAVVGKNPGSAKPSARGITTLQPILLDGDKMLPTVAGVVAKAFAAAGKRPRPGEYIQVLNLFYLCDSNLAAALRRISQCPSAINCETEVNQHSWLWYVWGGPDPKLASYKERFANANTQHHFYLDKLSGRVVATPPGSKGFAKHTQGMVQEHVIRHVAGLL